MSILSGLRKLHVPPSAILIAAILIAAFSAATTSYANQQTKPRNQDLVLEFKLSNKGSVPWPSNQVTIFVKGKKSRMELALIGGPPMMPKGPLSVSILDGETGESVGLFPMNKTYIKVSHEEAKESKDLLFGMSQKWGGIPAERPELEATDEVRELRGQKARKYIGSNQRQQLVYWIIDTEDWREVARRVALATATPAGSLLNMQFPDIERTPGFPVIVEIAMDMPQMGTVVSTTELIDYKWTTLGHHLFEIPDDYEATERKLFVIPGGGS